MDFSCRLALPTGTSAVGLALAWQLLLAADTLPQVEHRSQTEPG